MLAAFFLALKKGGVPVSIREYLDLLAVLDARLVFADIDRFYTLARLAMVKDEKYFDRFDRVFGVWYQGVESGSFDLAALDLPADWLRREMEKIFSPEEMAAIQSQGDLKKLLELFEQRLREQKERHQGGNKWIGTAGTSPFGAFGYNPQGIRIGQGRSRHRRAIKVWEDRQYRDLDDSVSLGVRNLQVALRRLRVFAREGARQELDLDGTIAATARNAGWLDLKMRAERHNAVKVLLLFDIGGSMDDHVRLCEALFSAAKSEFKHMETFYFHNCVYETLWRNNARRRDSSLATFDVLHRYPSDYKLIVVGDATMSPYEVAMAGASVEHFNEEAGSVWLERLRATFPAAVWLNPVDSRYWPATPSINMIRQIFADQMYALTPQGLAAAMQQLSASYNTATSAG